ncbi:thioredoxin [Paraglaciecola sp. L3A3]|uniref:thioredoxin n=1 Tax=Paraglaciecola sp. L3A3 TaxID=2686358 RepID=UPI00131D03FC|nr:thioredoxin [Paraglaciecola sp. L3A3]
MKNVTEIVGNDFATEVEAQQGPVLVDFFAHWCAPCKVISPLIEEIATEYEAVKVVKVDADEAQDIMVKFGVRSIPTLLLFNQGKVVASSVGAISLPKLREFVSQGL